MDTDNTQIELNLALRALQERANAEQKAANDLLGLQLSNAQKLYNVQQEYLNREEKERLEKEQYINERLIKMGFKTAAITAKSLEERLKDIDKQEKVALKGKRGGAAVKIRKEYEQATHHHPPACLRCNGGAGASEMSRWGQGGRGG